MKKYQDYKDPDSNEARKHDLDLTKEELARVEWTKFKIVVPTAADKAELEEALHYIHNSDIDTDYITVNQVAHTYLNEEEGYINNIIVNKELYESLPEYGKAEIEVKTFEEFKKTN